MALQPISPSMPIAVQVEMLEVQVRESSGLVLAQLLIHFLVHSLDKVPYVTEPIQTVHVDKLELLHLVVLYPPVIRHP